jgi:hypothetical protein
MIGRIFARVLILLASAYLMSALVGVFAVLLAVVVFGDFVRALDELPKTPYFAPAILGYLAASTGAAIGTLIGCLPSLAAPAAEYRRAVNRGVLLCGGGAALVSAVWGGTLDFWVPLTPEIGRAAFGVGAVAGVVWPACLWVIRKSVFRSPEVG